MIQEALKKVVAGKSLTLDEARSAMGEIMRGEVSPTVIGGYLVALRMKGETTEEIAGSALAMRAAAQKVSLNGETLLDTCGTGGDGAGTFNISTAAAFAAAGAGFLVAKHGNRSISSRSGSADVLEALGVNVQAVPEVVARCVREAGIGFFFAPTFHPAMRHAGPVRKELGVRTLFNLLGPLTNPAGAKAQVIGVYDEKLVKTVAAVLNHLGVSHAFVVHDRGCDEITLTGTALAAEVSGSKVRLKRLAPSDFGLKKVSASAIAGGTAQENAETLWKILDGKKSALSDVVAANAGLAILTAERAVRPHSGLTLKQAVQQALESLSGGKAKAALERLKDVSHGR